MEPKNMSQPAEKSRFEVVRVLGFGGMACVYEVFDRGLQRRLALKRLQESSDQQRQRRLLELFEREFYTLSQLSHPAIVQAFDYGIDDKGPYYTMELLEGGELQSLAPLPYKQACLVARHICSALSLLHSRRLVYRDLNPRNVHCNAQGTPKLIDFGAIVAMGPSAQVVGTPAYCAPEAIDMQPLDARTDLFSLGATLYYALTGKHAFPGKSFAQVRQLWDTQPRRPSAYVPGLPPALDSLVMDLLKLDPAARPANASELMEQLAAITGQTIDESSGVTQAYLSTPSMVGREPQLAQVRAKLKRAAHGHGGSVLITSASGAGRSRFLAACQIEAKMSGVLVAHAASSDSPGEYGVVRALGHSLLDVAPDLARHAAREGREILERLVPTLARYSLRPAAELAGAFPRAQVLAAVRAWFTSVASERPLLLAIDDFHRADEPSAASVAWIAHGCDQHAMLLIASSETEASAFSPAAFKLYEGGASKVSLENLSDAQTAALLRSVFGSVPHVQALARKLFAIAAGNPRDTMRLAQTLVDRGVARYRSGAWSLPAKFDEGWLPDSMHQAVVRELDALDPVARGLALVLSLAEDRTLNFEECALTCHVLPAKAVHVALQQLLQTQFAKVEADRYTIAHRGLHPAIRGTMQPEALSVAHAQIADIFERRGDEPFRYAKHLLLSGKTDRGVDALVEFAVTSQARTDHDPNEYVQLVLSMPDDWLDVFDTAIAGCTQVWRRPTDTFRLRNRLASLLNVMGSASHFHLLALIRQLCRDSGLDAYAALDPQLNRGERLKRALEEAKQRYETTPEQERGLEPGLAMRSLVRALMLAAGMVALGLDYELWQALPSIAPLEALSPAFGVVERLVGAVAARVAGRHEHARSVYTQLLERLDQSDRAGIDPSNHRFLRFGVMYGVALIEAGMGLQSCLGRADTLESEPLHAVNALQVRMVHALWQGRVREADQLREAAELRRIESGGRQMADGSHLVCQMLGHAYSDDLTRLKQVIEELRALAQRCPAWTAVVSYALAEHQRMRGDSAQALEHLNAASSQLTAGTHQIWPHVAAAQVGALCVQERIEEAVRVGESHLQAADRAELGYLANYIRIQLAIACARLGEHGRAQELAEEALRIFQTLETSGLNLVLVYEACCRVAWYAGRIDDHQHYALRCAEASSVMTGQALRARMERLLRNHGAVSSILPVRLTSQAVAPSVIEPASKSVFRACDQPRQRAERTLQLLLSQSGAQAGVLYLVGKRGPALAAQIGPEPTPELTASVLELIDAEERQREFATASVDAAPGSELSTAIGGSSLVLLCHQTSGGVAVSGVAALAVLPGMKLINPGSLAARLSRALVEAGDVFPLG